MKNIYKYSTVLIILLFFIKFKLYSQEFTSYNRSGISWVYFETDSKYKKILSTVINRPDLVIEDGFDDNRLAKFKYYMNNNVKFKNGLQYYQISSKVMYNLMFEKGIYNEDEILSRAKYSMSDADIKQFESSAIGLAGAGRKWMDIILESNYIVAFKISNVKSMEEYYDEVDKKNKEWAKKDARWKYEPIKRTHVGYRAKMESELYKIVFNDSVKTIFWNKCFDSNGKPLEKEIKKFNFPVKLAGKEEFVLTGGSVFKSTPGLDKYTQFTFFNKMLNKDAFNVLLLRYKKSVEDFVVKTPVYNTNPLQAKIGKKEKVKTDKKYYVYEKQLDGDGKIIVKRVAVIRAKNHVTDNRHVSSGSTNPSNFYQIQGKRIDKGMLIKENDDFAGITFGYGNEGLNMKLEFLTPKLFGDLFYGARVYFDYSLNPIKYDKSYLDNNIDVSKIDINDGEGLHYDTDASQRGFGLGVIKDFHFLRNFFTGINLGISSEKIQFSNKKVDAYFETLKTDDYTYGKRITSYNLKTGLRLGMYVTPKIKVLGSVNYMTGNYEKDDVFGKTSHYYNEYVPLRWYITLGFGL